jgi:DNA-binding beta-propeller fold protein YncE
MARSQLTPTARFTYGSVMSRLPTTVRALRATPFLLILLPVAARAGTIEAQRAVAAEPGETVTVSVTLRTMGDAIVATQNDLGYDAHAPIAAGPEGEPDCTVNPSIDKPDAVFGFLPAGCGVAEACTSIRAVIVSLENIDPILDGAVLYSCRVAVPETTPSGTYRLAIDEVVLVDENGDEFADARGSDGSVVVTGATPIAYVTSFDGLTLLETASNRTVATIELPELAQFLSLSPDGASLAVTSETETVTFIDTAAREVRTTIFDLPRYAGSSFSPDGSFLYALRYGVDPSSSVSLIDPLAGEVTGSIGLDADLFPRIAVRPDGRKGYVPRLFRSDEFPFDITVVDLIENRVETFIELPCGVLMYDVAFSPDGKRLYVPVLGGSSCDGVAGVAGGTGGCAGDCNGDDTVAINELILGVNIALGTAALDACATLAGGDGRVDIADLIGAVNRALSGCTDAVPEGDFAAVIDTSTQQIFQVIDLGRAAPGIRAAIGQSAGAAVQSTEGLGIAVSSDGRFGYVTACGEGLCVLDLAQNIVIDTVALPGTFELPGGGTGSITAVNIDLTPDGRLAYVTLLAGGPPPEREGLDELNSVAVVDLERGEVADLISVPFANDVVIGPPCADDCPPFTPTPTMEITPTPTPPSGDGCPVDFSDDNTEPGSDACIYTGSWNPYCGGNDLRSGWVSDGETVAMLFAEFSDVQCVGEVTSPTSATVLGCFLGPDEDDFDPRGGQMTLSSNGAFLTFDPEEFAFIVDRCPVRLYSGSFVAIVSPASVASERQTLIARGRAALRR